MAVVPKKSPAKAPKARSTAPARPKMVNRIVEAIQAQPASNKGVSIQTIKGYIAAKYELENNKTLSNSLRKGFAEGIAKELLVRPKGSESTGLTGRYKLNKVKLASLEKEKNKKEKLATKRAEIKEKASKAKKTEKPKSRVEKPKKAAANKEKKSPKKVEKKVTKKTVGAKTADKAKKTAGKKAPPTPKGPATPKFSAKNAKKAAKSTKVAQTPREKLKTSKSKKRA